MDIFIPNVMRQSITVSIKTGTSRILIVYKNISGIKSLKYLHSTYLNHKSPIFSPKDATITPHHNNPELTRHTAHHRCSGVNPGPIYHNKGVPQ